MVFVPPKDGINMPLSRRELILRLSALYAAGVTGSLPQLVIAEPDVGSGPTVEPSVDPVDGPVAATGVGTEVGASPAVEAAPPAPFPSGATPVIWDGASGVCRDFFNFGIRLPWENVGGDWSDVANIAQGNSPFATIEFAASAAWASATITPLVMSWYTNANTGIYLRCLKNACYVASRTNANASLQPVITLKLSDGTAVDMACIGTGITTLTASMPITGQELVLQTGSQASSMVLQFTLPSLGTRTIASAVLKLYATRIYGACTCAVFALRPPLIFDGGAPVPGIASRYTRDTGIEADPLVYFATQFDETGWQSKTFAIGALDADSYTHDDAELGTPALHVKYHIDEFSPCYLDYMWSQRKAGLALMNAAGTLKARENIVPSQYDSLNNEDCPSEVYFRYYLKLDADYQCSTDAKKLPGVAGRYGYFYGDDKYGYYQAVAGNGGAPTKGTKVLNNAYPNGFYYSGWSMRHLAGVGPADANPYKACVYANTYAYHVGMAESTGDHWRWGTASTGWVIYEPDRWYCIEHYVKMNTISGPFDALGNGTGNADGIIRGWVDGVLVFERTNVIYRRHPAIRVDEIWLDHYHGGTIRAEAEHGFEMANVVVAASYIGPMGGGPVVIPPTTTATPSWLQSKPTNQWIAIPGTELARSMCADQASAGLTNAQYQDIGYGDPRRGITAYSGGTLKKSGSELLIFGGGGGGGGWAGNDVRGLRLEDDAPQWQTRVKPSRATVVPAATSPATPYMLDGVSPNARHSYWQPQFIDAMDAFMAFGCTNTWNSDTGQFYNVDSAVFATDGWRAPGSHPNVPIGRGWDGNWACKHPVTEDIYVSGARGIARWSPKTNAWTTVFTTTRSDVDRATAAIDPTGSGVLLRIGDYATKNVPVAIDLVSGAATAGTFTGPYAAAINIGAYYAAGLVYDPVLAKFLLFQDDGHLYTITRLSMSSWSVDRLALAGTPPDIMHSAGAGRPAIWGRMQYVPNLRGVCIVQAYDRPAYFVKTA